MISLKDTSALTALRNLLRNFYYHFPFVHNKMVVFRIQMLPFAASFAQLHLNKWASFPAIFLTKGYTDIFTFVEYICKFFYARLTFRIWYTYASSSMRTTGKIFQIREIPRATAQRKARVKYLKSNILAPLSLPWVIIPTLKRQPQLCGVSIKIRRSEVKWRESRPGRVG